MNRDKIFRFFIISVVLLAPYLCIQQLLLGRELNETSIFLNGNHITAHQLKKILHGDMCQELGFEMQWNYVGQLQNGHYIFWSAVDEPIYCSWGLHVLKLENEKLTVTDTIDGCRCCEVLDGEIDGNQVIYHQIVSSGVLLDTAASLFPEFKKWYDVNPRNGICYGKAGFVGTFRFAAQITEEGKVQEPNLVSFHPAEGWPPYSQKVFKKGDLEKLAFDILLDSTKEASVDLKWQ